MWVHVKIRSVIGVTSGPAARNSVGTSRRFEPEVMSAPPE
jgi:hypothetical protein